MSIGAKQERHKNRYYVIDKRMCVQVCEYVPLLWGKYKLIVKENGFGGVSTKHGEVWGYHRTSIESV